MSAETLLETVDQYRDATYADISAVLLAVAFEPAKGLEHKLDQTLGRNRARSSAEEIDTARSVGRTIRRLSILHTAVRAVVYGALGAAGGFGVAHLLMVGQSEQTKDPGYSTAVNHAGDQLTIVAVTCGFGVAGAIQGLSFPKRAQYAQGRAANIVDGQLAAVPDPTGIGMPPPSETQVIWSSKDGLVGAVAE